LERAEANLQLVSKIEENRQKRIEEAERRIQLREIRSISAQQEEHKTRNLENEEAMVKWPQQEEHKPQLTVAREHEQELLEKKLRDFGEREKKNQKKAELEKLARITALANNQRERIKCNFETKMGI
jgi:hypothetical protein